VATDEEQKSHLKQFVAGIDSFANWGHADKIRLFAWLQHHLWNRDRFSTSDINWCYNALSYKLSNSAQYLINMEGRGELLQDKRGYYGEGKFVAKYDQLYGVHEITLNIRHKVKDLINKVPDVAEKDFMKEAELCLRHDAGRATVIMVWNVAFYHLCQFILKHSLAKFNAGYQTHYNKLWQQAKVQTVAAYDDFLTVKESVVIDICKRELIITQTQFKILDKRLGERNTAAHPNSAKVGQLQAEAFIEDIVDNVVLALHI
jgi:hypothetical protein